MRVLRASFHAALAVLSDATEGMLRLILQYLSYVNSAVSNPLQYFP